MFPRDKNRQLAFFKKLSCRRQTARRISANAMAWLTSQKHCLNICVTTPNLVVLGVTVYA